MKKIKLINLKESTICVGHQKKLWNTKQGKACNTNFKKTMALTYGNETWTHRRIDERQLEAAEMQFLSYTSIAGYRLDGTKLGHN